MHEELAPVAAAHPPLTEVPLELSVRFMPTGAHPPVATKIVLSSGSFLFEQLGDQKKKHTFSLPAREVLDVQTDAWLPEPDPVYTAQTLRFARDLKPTGGPEARSST